MDERGCIVLRLQKALYGCIESVALWHDNLSATMSELGYEKNKHKGCVFNKRKDGIQCTVALHVDDLLITSVSVPLIDELCDVFCSTTFHKGCNLLREISERILKNKKVLRFADEVFVIYFTHAILA